MSSWPIRDATSTIYPLYSRANVGEILPDPITPLNASAGSSTPGGRLARRLRQLGAWDHDIYDADVEGNPIACFQRLHLHQHEPDAPVRCPGSRLHARKPSTCSTSATCRASPLVRESERRDFDDDEACSGPRAGPWLVGEVLGATDPRPVRCRPPARVLDHPGPTGRTCAGARRRGNSRPRSPRSTTTCGHFFPQPHRGQPREPASGLGAVAQVSAAPWVVRSFALTLSRRAWRRGLRRRLGGACGRLSRTVRRGCPPWARQFAAGTRGSGGTSCVCTPATKEATKSLPGEGARRVPGRVGLPRPEWSWELRVPTWGTVPPKLALRTIDRLRPRRRRGRARDRKNRQPGRRSGRPARPRRFAPLLAGKRRRCRRPRQVLARRPHFGCATASGSAPLGGDADARAATGRARTRPPGRWPPA